MTGALLCVLLAQAAPQPRGIVAGIEAFGEFFPRSNVNVPGSAEPQQSVLTGPRLVVGYSHHERFRALATFQLGYAAAGLRAGDGDDGFMVGAGLEADLVLHRWLMPFVRLAYDVKLTDRATNPKGTLGDLAVVAAIGVRALRFLDVDLCAGRDFAGGLSVGLGVALGWSWFFLPLD